MRIPVTLTAIALALGVVAAANSQVYKPTGGGGSSSITAGTTATSGCAAGGVLFSASSLTQCDAGLTYTGVGATDSLRMVNAGTGPEYGGCGWFTANIFSCGVNTNAGTARQFQIVTSSGAPALTFSAGSIVGTFASNLQVTGGLSLGSPATLSILLGGISMKTAQTGTAGAATITISTAPGAAGGMLLFACGTSAGTGALYAAAGSSTTATLLLNNIGSGVTGC